jgi:glycosyltransferase involved in cell wall biosynthesis
MEGMDLCVATAEEPAPNRAAHLAKPRTGWRLSVVNGHRKRERQAAQGRMGQRITHPGARRSFEGMAVRTAVGMYAAAQPNATINCMVSVIIPVLNEVAIAGTALETLLQQRGSYEVIVVDGGSVDGTVDVVRQFPVQLVQQPASMPPGLSSQINRGVQKAGGNILLFLHIDVELPPLGIARIEAALADHHIIGGGFIPSFYGPVPASARLRLAVVERVWKIGTGGFQWFVGDTAPFIRSDVFWRSGAYPPAVFASDLDFARRMQKLGRLAVIRDPARIHNRRLVQNGVFTTSLVTLSVNVLFSLRADRVFLRDWYQKWLPRER